MVERKTITARFITIPVPALFLAAFGLGLMLLAAENFFLPTIQHINISENPDPTPLFFLFAMIGLITWQWKNLESSKGQTLLSLMAAVIFTSTLFILYSPGVLISIIIPHAVLMSMKMLCETLLLFFWVRALVCYGVRAVTLIFALATIIFALLNCLTILLKTEAAIGMLLSLPIIATGCLCYLREYQKTHEIGAPAAVDSTLVREHNGGSHRYHWIIFTMTMIVPMFCYSFIFGTINFHWKQEQDGATLSMLIQLGAACGSGLCGLFILALVRFFWSRDNIELCKALLLPIVIIALWLTSFINANWIFLYLVLLGTAQKFLMLFIMLAPFMLEKAARLAPWCLAIMSLSVGRAVNSMLLAGMSDSVILISSLIALGLLLICSILPTLLSNASDTELASNPIRMDVQDTYIPDNQGEKSVMKLHNATHVLAERYSLTSREEEVLVLLARGRTSVYVAEALVISQLTAKTHQKNIYAKMQIHSQQELIGLTEDVINEQRTVTNRHTGGTYVPRQTTP